MRAWLFNPGSHDKAVSFGLLIARLSAGLSMAVAHGWGKLSTFGEKAASFPDPLGIGRPFSMAGAIGAEFVCAILVALGLGTRVAAVPLVFTMSVAFFRIHANDPFGTKEKALLFLTIFLLLVFTGAGAYSLDAKFGGRGGGKKRR